VLRIPNVQNRRVSLENLKYATQAADLRRPEALETGDFLFIRTNGSRSLIGRGALIERPFPKPHFFASYLIRLRLVRVGCLPEWAAFAWHSDTVRRQVLEEVASSAGQYNLSLGSALRFTMPLPPLAEQARILEKAADLASIGEAACGTVDFARDRSSRLRQAILKWAFEGKLVDQDPNDEPASVLLERIRQARTVEAKEGRETKATRKARRAK
jgi:type I restriction enzyme S subunit